MAPSKQSELLGLSLQELTGIVEAAGEPAYRARQLYQALYQQRVTRIEQVSSLPAAFREWLRQVGYGIGAPQLRRRYQSSDGTVRYLLEFADGQSVETVWMPEGDGGEAGDGSEAGDEEAGRRSGGAPLSPPGATRERQGGSHRATICVSSQAGCAVSCRFCLTAQLGLLRNLTAGEIVGQVLVALNEHAVKLDSERINLVFMGQGEPFLNYENFMAAVRLLVEGVGIAESRMTVSTSGIVPRIEEFGREPLRPKLAISLNASEEAAREELMPLTRKWSLEQLLDAARRFPLRPRERLTFEYVLLDGVNDAVEHARQVVELLRGMRAKVNLIALNPGPDIPFGTPSEDRVRAFQQTLMSGGIPAFVRRPRGRDIYAACGQLKKSELTGIA